MGKSHQTNKGLSPDSIIMSLTGECNLTHSSATCMLYAADTIQVTKKVMHRTPDPKLLLSL